MTRKSSSEIPAPGSQVLVKKPVLCTVYSMSLATIDRRIKSDPEFPKPVKLGDNSVAFYFPQVESYRDTLLRRSGLSEFPQSQYSSGGSCNCLDPE